MISPWIRGSIVRITAASTIMGKPKHSSGQLHEKYLEVAIPSHCEAEGVFRQTAGTRAGDR